MTRSTSWLRSSLAKGGDPILLLGELEAYYDAVPRSAARCEQIGPFSLFVRPGPGMPFYARPAPGATAFTADDVQGVRARQRELGVPESFEWVAETTPALADAAMQAGLAVSRHPLMVLQEPPDLSLAAPDDHVEVRLANVDDDLALMNAVARLAFGAPGSAVGPAGLEEARATVESNATALASRREGLRGGRTVTAVALVGGLPVGVGSHQPVGSVSEIVGVGVLPAFRRQGIATAVTRLLMHDALQRRGVQTVFLSAHVDRMYARLGFRTVGTACIAEPP